QVVHPPGVNYIVGHGVAGMVIDWFDPKALAKQLVKQRGLAGGDVLFLIICGAGTAGGVAEQLAACIRERRVTGVKGRAPQSYIHRNAHGELLVTDYNFPDPRLDEAEKAWVKAGDSAWRHYIGLLKAMACEAIGQVPPKDMTALKDRILRFANARPDNNKQS